MWMLMKGGVAVRATVVNSATKNVPFFKFHTHLFSLTWFHPLCVIKKRTQRSAYDNRRKNKILFGTTLPVELFLKTWRDSMLEPIEQYQFWCCFYCWEHSTLTFSSIRRESDVWIVTKKIRAPKLPHSPIERMVSGIFFFFFLLFLKKKKKKKNKIKKWLLPGWSCQ
jgi:hypothetical protein